MLFLYRIKANANRELNENTFAFVETNQAIIFFLTTAFILSRTILIMVIKWKCRHIPLCHWVSYLDLSINIMRSSINRFNRVTAIETKMERDRMVSDGDFTCMATRREMHFTIHVF